MLGIKGREVACSNCGYLLTVEDHVVVAKDHSDSKTGSSKSNISVIDVDAREVGDE